MTQDDLIGRIAALLGECRTACLATADSDGQPHACNVQFAPDHALQLYFISSQSSEHAKHIARTCEVAAAIYGHDDAEPANLHGVQLRGACTPVVLDDSDNWQQAWDAYAGRFEFVKQPPFREMAQSQQMYVVQPQWIRLIDNREGFGFKQELNL